MAEGLNDTAPMDWQNILFHPLEREWQRAAGRGDAAPFPAFYFHPRRFAELRVVIDTAPANATPGEINAMIASQFWAIRVPDAAPYPAANMDRRRLDLGIYWVWAFTTWAFSPLGHAPRGMKRVKGAIEQAKNEGNDIGDGNGKSKYQRRASRGDEDGGKSSCLEDSLATRCGNEEEYVRLARLITGAKAQWTGSLRIEYTSTGVVLKRPLTGHQHC